MSEVFPLFRRDAMQTVNVTSRIDTPSGSPARGGRLQVSVIAGTIRRRRKISCMDIAQKEKKKRDYPSEDVGVTNWNVCLTHFGTSSSTHDSGMPEVLTCCIRCLWLGCRSQVPEVVRGEIRVCDHLSALPDSSRRPGVVSITTFIISFLSSV